MGLREAYLDMIRAFPGTWDAIAPALGFSHAALQNRVYEVKGQVVSTESALMMQRLTGMTRFAEEVAQLSGGVFMRLPEVGDHGRDELLSKFNELYAELGELSGKFRESVADGEVDSLEWDGLTHVGHEIHRTLEELLALTAQVYRRGGSDVRV